MTLLETLALALALCVDSLAVSTSSALQSKMAYRRGLLLAVTFGIFQGGLPLAGVLLGSTFAAIMADIDHWIAFGLLAIVGGKMIADGVKGDSEAHPLDVTRFGVICLMALATSIDAFVVGIGLGLRYGVGECLRICAVIGIMTFVVSITGVFLGRRDIPIPRRVSSIVAGLVLIGIGTHTLLEHLLGL